MPPKTKKASAKKSNATGAAASDKNWETGLITAPFEEGSWQACVSLVVGRSPEEEEELTRGLALAAQRPLRRLFHLLTYDGALAQIHVLGNPKAKKPDEIPPFYEVTEAAKVLLDAGQEIPCDLMAKVLKFQLLQIKASDQRRREAEQAARPFSASQDIAGARVSEKKGKNPPSPVEHKRTKLKRRDHTEPPKFIDDEPEDGPQCYILLLGLYQPRLIGALDAVGVHVANVIRLCSQTSAGKQEEQDTEVEDGGDLAAQTRKLALFWSGLRPVLDSGPPESRLHDVVQLSYTLPQFLSPCDAPDPEAELETGTRIFEGVASLIYVCVERRRQHRRYLDSMKLISVPTVAGPELQDVHTPPPMSPRSRKKSLQEENPLEREFEWPPLSTDVDVRYYRNLLDRVPPEACSVPLILHCLLEQVAISAEQPSSTTETEETKPHPGPWLDQQLVSFMLQSFLPLAHSEEERSHMLNSLVTAVQSEEDKKRLVESFGAEDTQKKPEQPLVIRHHDERALRLRDVNAAQGFDPAEVERSMTRLSPVWELIHSGAQRRTSASCWSAVKQQLQHGCSDDVVSWLEVEHLFHQSVFESMPLTRVNQEGVLVNAPGPLGRLEADAVIPWDKPQCYAKQQLKNLQNKGQTFLTEDPGNTEIREGVCFQLDLSDIQRHRLRSLIDWHYTEHHDASVLPQVLQSASEECRCLDTFRGSRNNTLYIFCHNPMSRQRQCTEFWDVSLHTDVKFRKYLEHVADTISDWTQEEEVKREAERLSPKDGKVTDSEEEEEEEEEEGTLEPFIRKDSLKAWKLEQERLKEEEMAKKSKKEKKQQQEEAKKATDEKSRAGTAGSPAETPEESVTGTAPPVVDNAEPRPAEEPYKEFTGYSTGGRLVRVSGRLQYLFPSDGGRVTVENVSFVEGSSLTKVAVDKDGHRFCTHVDRVVVDPAPRPRDKGAVKVSESVVRRVRQGSFTAVLDSGVRLSYSFYGPTGECTGLQATDQVAPETSTLVPVPHSSSTHRSKETDPDSVPSETHSRTRPAESQVCEDHPASPFNRLNVSVPNGLLLQFQREDPQGGSSPEHGVSVRQRFPLHGRGTAGQLQEPSLTQEQSRTVTNTGAVIRHMRDGSTEVLFADGSVSFSPDSGPVWVPDSEVEEENTSETETASQRGCWFTTTPCGARIHTVGSTHRRVPATPLLAFKATDPITREVMLSREDLVVSVQHPDGSLSVKHADGTRISSLLQDRAANTPEAGPDSAGVRDAEEETSGDGRQSDEGGAAPREKVVLVEKEGCATVVMYPERRTAHVFLADGTVITGDDRGAYEVFPSRGGLLQIHSNGTCVYSSDLPATPGPTGGAPANPPGSYAMSHTDQIACDITDLDGNHFRVMDDGQSSVFGPAPARLDQNGESDAKDAPSWLFLLNDAFEFCNSGSRLFLVHEDGSGTELLSSRNAEGVIRQACADPAVALLKEPLPDTQDEFSITILKPSHQSVWSQWLLGKQNPDITPPNLRNRSWHDFPQTQAPVRLGQTPGEGSAGSPGRRRPVMGCPKVLEIRELTQHRPIGALLRDTVDARLKEHIESLMARERRSEEAKVKDPRTEEESIRASDLLNLVLSFAEEEGFVSCFDKRTSVDVFSLYNQRVGAPADQSDASEDTSPSDSFTSVKESDWTGRLERLRQEIREEQVHRAALRNHHVVPFFHPENVPLFQNLLQRQMPDVRSLSLDLPPIAKSESAEALLKDAPQQTTPRPLNTTASRSASHEAGSDRKLERRPTNPTPQTAGDGALRASPGQRRSVQADVSRKPRRTKVRPPACGVLSQQFPLAEEPVRRTCRSVSQTGPGTFPRGFQLLPSTVDFGTLQEDTSSSVTVRMKNVGVDPCRFQVKQPPPATGLRVLYRPGPVAAGLHVELQVQLFAGGAVRIGEEEPKKRVFQDIVVHTETDVLHLPVTATIVPRSFKDLTPERRSSRVQQPSSSLAGGRRGRKALQTTQRPPARSVSERGKH